MPGRPLDKLRLSVLSAAFCVLLGAAGCGPGEGGDDRAGPMSAVQKVIASDRLYTIDDLDTVDFKTAKEYDVSGLEKAVAAFHGFWGLDPYNRAEYEARFYGSHEDALTVGAEWADMVTGENAVITGSSVQWEEGARDRRRCSRPTAHSGCNYTPTYGDYVIRGNLVLLCEGRTPEDALLNCQELMDRVN